MNSSSTLLLATFFRCLRLPLPFPPYAHCQVTRFVGFNPEFKRTVAYATRTPTVSAEASRSKTADSGAAVKLRIGKGLVDKVMSTGSDGGDCWEVSAAPA